MIQENEIKIGNWFEHNENWCYRRDDDSNDDKPFKFQWNSSDWYKLGDCLIFLEDIKPIPLTEQWLRDFGFFVDGSKAHIVYNESGNIYNLNRIGDTFHSSYLATEIPFVHILQNHFFFNIGEELTYNP